MALQNTFGPNPPQTRFNHPRPAPGFTPTVRNPYSGVGSTHVTINPSSGLGAALTTTPINPRSGAVTNVRRVNPASGLGAASKTGVITVTPTRPWGMAAYAGLQGANKAAAASELGKYNPNYYSQLEAWVNSRKFVDLATSKLNLSDTITGNAMKLADYQSQAKDIQAGANAEAARYRENLAYSGDLKGYYTNMYNLQIRTAGLKAQALANAVEANNRGDPLLRGKITNVNEAYATDLARMKTQEHSTLVGYQMNRTEQSAAQNAAGALTSTRTVQDVQKINSDYADAMATIGQDRSNVTIKHRGDIADLGEAIQVLNDNRKQYGVDLQNIGIEKENALNEYNHNIADINHGLRLGKINANEAAQRAAVARQNAAQQGALLAQANANARNRAKVQEVEAINAANDNRQAAVNSGAFGTPPPHTTPFPAPFAPGFGGRPAEAPGTNSGVLAAPGMKPGTPVGQFNPDINYLRNQNNPLGISDAAWNQILWQAGVQSGGDPVKKMYAIQNYVNFFSPIIMRSVADQQAAARHGG